MSRDPILRKLACGGCLPGVYVCSRCRPLGLHWLATIGLVVDAWVYAWGRDRNAVISDTRIVTSSVSLDMIRAAWRARGQLEESKVFEVVYQAARKAELKRRSP